MKATRSFLALTTLIIAGLMVISAILAPVGNVDGVEVNLGMYNLTRLPLFLALSVVRLLIGVVIFLVTASVKLRFISIRSWWQFREELKKRDNNDSLAIQVACDFFSSMILAAGVPLTTFVAYLINIIFRGGAAYFLTIWVTALISRLLGDVTSRQEYTDWIREPDNDGYAILVGFIQIGIMFVCVFGR